MISELRRRWEERAQRKSNACDGVLFQGLPPELNRYLHERHVHALIRFLSLVPRGGRLLDIGCGYGRLGGVVREVRPDLEVIGTDFSLAYCAAFRRNVAAPAVGAELSRLPFRPESFDALVAVTVLMYAPVEQRGQVLSAMSALLRAGGVMLLIDPGAEVQRAVAMVKPAAARSTTGGNGFALGGIPQLASRCSLQIEDCGGMPWGTFTLPLLYGLITLRLPTGGLLRWLGRRDDNHGGETRWSLHRWTILRRPARDAAES